MSHVNWPNLIRAGLTQLRLQPRDFWALTPAELMVMLGQGSGAAPMGRARLSDLLRAYPDTPPDAGNERMQHDE